MIHSHFLTVAAKTQCVSPSDLSPSPTAYSDSHTRGNWVTYIPVLSVHVQPEVRVRIRSNGRSDAGESSVFQAKIAAQIGLRAENAWHRWSSRLARAHTIARSHGCHLERCYLVLVPPARSTARSRTDFSLPPPRRGLAAARCISALWCTLICTRTVLCEYEHEHIVLWLLCCTPTPRPALLYE